VIDQSEWRSKVDFSQSEKGETFCMVNLPKDINTQFLKNILKNKLGLI